MTNIIVPQVVTPKMAKSAVLYRQILVIFGSSLLAVSGGITFGITAVLLPKLQADSTYAYDKSYDSWIASISPLAMLMGCIFSGAMSDIFGRKKGQLILVAPFIIGWVVMGLANTNTLMLVGRFITGLCTGAVRANSMVYIGELCDPKYRTVALFCPTLGIQLGVLISHTIGKYINWRIGCFLFTLPNIICFAILVFFKESPLWLLSRGRIDEGIASFRQYRGKGESAEKELASVLESIKEKANDLTPRVFFNIVVSKPFLKSILTIILLFISVQWCGINTISFYAEDIFEKTFSGKINAFMLLIVTDCIRVMTTITVCIFSKFIPRKATFIACCFLTTFVLLALVTYLYLDPPGLIWVAVISLVLYIAIATIITTISWTFIAEIFPAKVRGFASGVSSSISLGLLFISVKVTPEIIYSYGEISMFTAFGAVTLLTAIFLIFVLPDTSGKSLQEIENDLYEKKIDEQKNIHVVTVSSL